MADVNKTVDIIVKAQTANANSALSSLAKGGILAVAVAAAAAAKALIHLGVEGFQALTKFINQSIQASADFDKALTQTQAVIKSTGGAAGVSARQMADLADHFQRNSTFANSSILSMQNVLLTFTKLGGDVLPQATQTVLDMSTALGVDLKMTAIQVGKALQDPVLGVTALRRVGVNFTESQGEVLRSLVATGREAEAQAIILKELAAEFGGSASAASRTFAGRLEDLSNVWGDLQREIGNFITQSPAVRAAIDAITSVLEDMIKAVQENGPAIARFLEGIFTTILIQGVPAARSISTFALAMAMATNPTWIPTLVNIKGKLGELFDEADRRAGIAVAGMMAWRKELEAAQRAAEDIPEPSEEDEDATDPVAYTEALDAAEELLAQHRAERAADEQKRREEAAIRAQQEKNQAIADAEERARAQMEADALAQQTMLQQFRSAKQDRISAELEFLQFMMDTQALDREEKQAILDEQNRLLVEQEELAYEQERERLLANQLATEELERAHKARMDAIAAGKAAADVELDESVNATRLQNLTAAAAATEAIQKAAFAKNKNWARAVAAMNIAVAITNAAQTNPYFPLGLLLTIQAAAMGAAQIMAIERAKYAKGGLVTGGRPGQDSVPILAQPGELIIPTDIAKTLLGPSPAVQGPTFDMLRSRLAGDGGSGRVTENNLNLHLSANGQSVGFDEAPPDFRLLAAGFNDLVERAGLRITATHVMVDGEPVPVTRLVQS